MLTSVEGATGPRSSASCSATARVGSDAGVDVDEPADAGAGAASAEEVAPKESIAPATTRRRKR
jgi:hypothetical protein